MTTLPKETEYHALKGQTWLLGGEARVMTESGLELRDFEQHGDTLRVTVAEYDRRNVVRITKETGNGVTQTEPGKYSVEFEATEMSQANLPLDTYYVESWINPGGTEKWFPLARGPLYLQRSSRG